MVPGEKYARVINPPLDLCLADIPAGTRDEPLRTSAWEAHDLIWLNRTLACIEMKSIFYDVLKLKRASKIKKYFDPHCYAACCETLLF